MKYYKNKKTKQISKFACSQGYFKGKGKNKKWVSDWEDTTKKEIDNFELEKQKPKLINKRKSYLNSTDWYVIRSIELSIEIPKEIKEKRDKAREEINEIEKITKKEDLLKFNNFEVKNA